jgi:hypothetical protein
VVPSLGIVGGAESRAEASERLLDAIAFTLESVNERSGAEDCEVSYVKVNLET